MARKVVKLFQFTIGPAGGSQTDISDYCESVDFDPGRNILTTMTAKAETELADRGFAAQKLSVAGHYDAAGTVAALFDTIEANGYADFTWLETKGAAEGAGNRKRTGTIAWPGAKEGGKVGDYAKWTIDGQSSEGLFILDVTP